MRRDKLISTSAEAGLDNGGTWTRATGTEAQVREAPRVSAERHLDGIVK